MNGLMDEQRSSHEAKKISVGIPFSFLFQRRHFSPGIHIHSKVLHWDSEVSILLTWHVLGGLQILRWGPGGQRTERVMPKGNPSVLVSIQTT